jgi:hypothetical protein
MASALNVFKTVTAELTTSPAILYTAPTGYTSIILMAQVSNVTGTKAKVTFSHFANSTTTELLKEFSVPANDAVSATTGKLVLETGASVKASSDTANALKITLSILESLNG